MADIWSRALRSKVMARIKGRGNQCTELVMVALFRRHGIQGWRRHLPLPGRPDFTFRHLRLVVFVDGCFWHGCPLHGRMPKSNRAFWNRKLRRNRERDREVAAQLRAKGWRVLRVWEHELKTEEELLRRISSAMGSKMTRTSKQSVPATQVKTGATT